MTVKILGLVLAGVFAYLAVTTYLGSLIGRVLHRAARRMDEWESERAEQETEQRIQAAREQLARDRHIAIDNWNRVGRR